MNSHQTVKSTKIFSLESFPLYSTPEFFLVVLLIFHFSLKAESITVCICLHDLFVRVSVTTSLSSSLSTEIANGGKPLFPGSDVDEQLKRVFKYPQSLLASFPGLQSPNAVEGLVKLLRRMTSGIHWG